MEKKIYTFGHSTHSIDRFIDMLERYGVDTVCDVRSAPYSSFNPQFSKDGLKESLRKRNKHYVFLGKELGARSSDPTCYKDGRVQYKALARTELFKTGIDRIKQGMKKGYKTALVCAEKDPIECHRTLLVARELDEQKIHVDHILADGSIETHQDLTERLVRQFKLNQGDLFLPEDNITEMAFEKQEGRIAYVDENYGKDNNSGAKL